ncbi:MAG: MFS transporter [Aquificaceae bacterium]
MKRLISFALYDSGETVLGALLFSTLYPLYITQHISVKIYSLFYSFAFFLSFLIALQMSRIADHRAWRKPFFILFSLFIPLFCLTLYLTFHKVELNFLLYLLLALVHQQALIFYNSLLKSFDAKGSASGFGVALGYVGSALALIFLAPRLSLPYAFLWLALIFLFLSLPSLLTLSEPKERQRVNLWKILKDRSFLLVLISMLLLMELAHTMIAMMGVYLREVYGLGYDEIYRTIGFSALGGVIGGLLWGRLTDKLSASRLFPLGFLLWSLFLIFLYGFPKEFLLPLGFLAGFSLSHLWTTSRVLLLERFAKGDIAVRFSFYSLSERIASSLGLFSWSLFLHLTEDYRLSALLMLFFPFLGFLTYRLSSRIP